MHAREGPDCLARVEMSNDLRVDIVYQLLPDLVKSEARAVRFSRVDLV